MGGEEGRRGTPWSTQGSGTHTSRDLVTHSGELPQSGRKSLELRIKEDLSAV